MPIVVVVSPGAFEEALRAADELEKQAELLGLAAPLDGANQGRVAEAWDVIRGVLREVFHHGAEASRSVMDQAVERVESLVAAAGARARDIEIALTGKLQEYVRALTDALLRQVRSEVTVGGRTMSIQSISIEQTISLTGSIKASLQEVCSLTSAGQLAVTAEYAVPPGT